MVRAARGEKVRLFEFVSVGLKNFKNAYFLVFFTIINLAIPILTFVFTAFITDWASKNGNSFLTVTFGILYLISTFFLFARFFYYVIGIFVMIDNKDKNIKQILDESKEIMSLFLCDDITYTKKYLDKKISEELVIKKEIIINKTSINQEKASESLKVYKYNQTPLKTNNLNIENKIPNSSNKGNHYLKFDNQR